jgi:hypothetical protein
MKATRARTTRRPARGAALPPRACHECGAPPMAHWRLCEICWSEKYGAPKPTQPSFTDESGAAA